MNRAGVFGLAAALAVIPAFWLSQASQASSGTALKRIHDPRHVTYSIHLATCYTRDHGQIPGRSCTPGSIDPAVTQGNIRSTICRARWTKKARPPEPQTQRAKYQVAYPAFHISARTRSELDHLVPLELGGSNDITNLWPEVGKIPNPKDRVENALNRAVCDKQVSLAAAQRAIAADWLTAEARLGLGPAPTPQPSQPSPPPPSPWCTASASYNAKYQDYDIYVHSNQPYRTVTATASNGATHSFHTDGTGYADVYLDANSGNNVQVQAGAASCSTTT